MKKYITLIIVLTLILIILLVLLFIQNKQNGYLICTYKSKTPTFETSSIYKIKFKNKYVETIETKEIITSNNKVMLEEYKATLEEIYRDYKDLKYYDYKVEIKNKELTTNVLINYNKLNKEEYINIDNSNENIYVEDKVPLKKLKDIYKEKGANCRYR